MKYWMTYERDASRPPPTSDEMAAIGAFAEETTKEGIVVLTGGILPMSQGARLRRRGGKVAVLDGPFAEAKEVVIGFAIVTAKDTAEAIEHASRFMAIAGDGDCEIRPLMMDDPE